MVGASKILTVSYGTFSCTLEGFDDPFNTMKAIAEYFRDLAAEDRYFGAEPPTPDAAMLHKIAEREVQRRVEAKVQENGVILRAQADDAPAQIGPEPAALVVAEIAAPAPQIDESADDGAFAEPVPAPVTEAISESFANEGDVTTADAAFFSQPVESFDAPPQDALPQPALSDMPEGVAARLAKIRAAVALTEAHPVAAASEYAEDQHADESFAAFETLEDTYVPSVADVSFSAIDDAEDIVDAEDMADLAALDGVELADMPGTEDLIDAAQDAAVSDAFGPEVSQYDAAELALADREDDHVAVDTLDTVEPVAVDAVAEPELADDAEMLTEAETADDDVLASLTAAFADDRPVATADADTIVFNDDDDLLLSERDSDGLVAEAMANEAAEEAVANEPQAEDSPAFDDELSFEPAEAMVDDAIADEPLTDAIALVEDDLLPEAVQDTAAAQALPEETATEAAAADNIAAATAEPGTVDKLQRARARIIRVRRAPEIAVEPKAEAAAPALSDEAEAELARELAALEDAAGDVAPEDTAAAVQDADDDLRRQLSALGADEPTALPTAAAVALDPAVQDESLRRLMDQTQSEMAEPANRRRLSSIAHLKAAVAATIAERFGTKPKPVEEVEATRAEPYRNDLARAVRPARPAGAGAATDRPTPLVLVSEQRIDRPAPAQPAGPVTPVRPRRVSAQAVAVREVYEDEEFEGEDDDTTNIFGDSKGFAEFADRIGATDLPDLLEAAAAYSSAVEGREHFTRPQLLRQIAAVTGADVTREDELRGFGALLRDGRIIKIKRGQFALTDQSTYLDAARSIGS